MRSPKGRSTRFLSCSYRVSRVFLQDCNVVHTCLYLLPRVSRKVSFPNVFAMRHGRVFNVVRTRLRRVYNVYLGRWRLR